MTNTNTLFDALRALREEIEGLSKIRTTLNVQERRAEMQMGEAESQLNALRLLRSYADGELARKREVLASLQKERDEIHRSLREQ